MKNAAPEKYKWIKECKTRSCKTKIQSSVLSLKKTVILYGCSETQKAFSSRMGSVNGNADCPFIWGKEKNQEAFITKSCRKRTLPNLGISVKWVDNQKLSKIVVFTLKMSQLDRSFTETFFFSRKLRYALFRCRLRTMFY